MAKLRVQLQREHRGRRFSTWKCEKQTIGPQRSNQYKGVDGLAHYHLFYTVFAACDKLVEPARTTRSETRSKPSLAPH